MTQYKNCCRSSKLKDEYSKKALFGWIKKGLKLLIFAFY